MDIKALRYFVELIKQKSFTKASERLFVTQPTISKMIKNLESSIGQPLIYREGRRFWLTEAGEIVYQRAITLLESLEQMHAELEDLEQLQRGHLRLGIPPMVGHLYAALIRRYKQQYPNVELTIVEYGGKRIKQALMEGEIDVALTMLESQRDNDFSKLALDNYPVHAIVPNTSKWRGIDVLTWEALEHEPFYIYTKEFTLSEFIDQRCQQAGFRPQVSARSSQWDFLVALVKSGNGVTFLPQPLCHRVKDDGVLVKPMAQSMQWSLGLIWHTQRYIPKAAEAWITLCRDATPTSAA
ncbi:LysR family transcriptional regulator [Vibrio aphrogenes]|uniref:LysR family transcriptional regulator n=1 Tax=Vibrio aphrogenes TaxID=1891186 RepID=UPI000B35E0AA|nr:LysR family transcriptional regulator [Vibrio aphrogenes]